MKRKSIIISISSYRLTKKEEELISSQKPWGIILFKRNVKNMDQLKELTSRIRFLMKDPYYPIMIDEEGGRVSRLSGIVDISNFPQNLFGKLFEKNKLLGINSYNEYLHFICQILKESGININTIPVLDLRRSFSHNIIGDRAYSNNEKIINQIGNISINLLHQNRIGSVIKHIPGHGLSKKDSHFKLPYINNKLKFLEKKDFSIFKDKNSLFAMTAHIVFKSIDKINCITHSKTGIKYIRNNIGFKNIIISDDISMKALKYSFTENVQKAYEAGCNLVLHCNSNLSEMNKLASIAPKVNHFIVKKTSEFYKLLS